jgi:hypothetical protein
MIGLFGTDALGQARMSAAKEPLTTLTGRLFDGVRDSPLPGAYVFAVVPDSKRILAHTTTLAKRGPDHAWWQLAGLPTQGDVILVAFHPQVKANMWMTRFALNGRYNDLRIVSTKLATHTIASDASIKGIWSLLYLAGWISHEMIATRANASAVELADSLIAQIRPTEEHSAPLTCSSTISMNDKLSLTMAAPHGSDLMIIRPDGGRYWVVWWASPNDTLKPMVSYKEFGDMNVWTVPARAVLGTRSISGVTPLQPVFSMPGTYTVRLSKNLESDDGTPVHTCRVSYTP